MKNLIIFLLLIFIVLQDIAFSASVESTVKMTVLPSIVINTSEVQSRNYYEVKVDTTSGNSIIEVVL